MTAEAASPPMTAPKTANATPFRAYATMRAWETQSTKEAAMKAQKKIESAYSPVSRLTRSFVFRAFVTKTYRSVPIEAPDPLFPDKK